MKKDIDLLIFNFYWNRLTYWQKKSLRLRASLPAFNDNLYRWLLSMFALSFSLVTSGLPFSDRRSAKSIHYINSRRKQTIRISTLGLFLFIVATIISTAWLIALHVEAYIAAPIIFATILFLNILIAFKPMRKRELLWQTKSMK